MRRNKLLGVFPESIGGRLTISSIFDGLEENGFEIVVYDLLEDETPDLKENYSAIVSYDYTAIKIKEKYNLKIPTLNYFSDLLRSRTAGENWEVYEKYLDDDKNYVFYWDRELSEYEKIKNLYYLPHFVNHNIYKNISKPVVDIMFAGRLDTDYRLNFIEKLVSDLPEYGFEWYAIERHYKDALNRAKNKDIIEKIYKGFIDNEEDMALAINRAKIVINMNSQGKSSLNYRTVQTAACERLMLSDYRDELDIFDGKMPYYSDIEDLERQIKIYLENPKTYEMVTKACKEIALKKLNSKDGAKFMLEKAGLTISL